MSDKPQSEQTVQTKKRKLLESAEGTSFEAFTATEWGLVIAPALYGAPPFSS